MKTITFLFSILLYSAHAQDTLTLSQALKEGLSNNYGIRVATMNQQIADNNNNWSGAMPTLNLNGSQTNSVNNSYQRSFTGEVREGNNLHSNNLAGSALLNWTIFDGMNMFVSKEKYSLIEQQSETQYRMAIETMTASVITKYHEIVLQTEVLKTLDTSINISQQRLTLARQKERLGAGSMLESSKAQADLNADSSAYLTQRFMIANSKAELNKLIGRGVDQSFAVKNEAAPNNILQYETLKSGMLKQNQELLNARYSESVARMNTKQTQSNRYPQLNLFAGYNYSRSTFAIGFAQYSRSYGPNYGVSASWTIFNGSQTSRAVQNSKIQEQISTLNTAETEQQLEKELHQTYSAYVMYRELQTLEQKNLIIIQQNIDIALQKYRIGSLSDLELRDIQATYLDGVVRLYNTTFQTRQYETSLLLLSGQLAGLNQN